MNNKIFMQGPDYSWYMVPVSSIKEFDKDSKKLSGEDFKAKYSESAIGMQPYDFKLKMEAEMALKDVDLAEASKSEKPKQDNVLEDEGGIFNFRFRNENVQVPAEWIDDTIILYLQLIDMHGWSFYQSLKINYDFTLPKPLENIIAFYTINDEA